MVWENSSPQDHAYVLPQQHNSLEALTRIHCVCDYGSFKERRHAKISQRRSCIKEMHWFAESKGDPNMKVCCPQDTLLSWCQYQGSAPELCFQSCHWDIIHRNDCLIAYAVELSHQVDWDHEITWLIFLVWPTCNLRLSGVASPNPEQKYAYPVCQRWSLWSQGQRPDLSLSQAYILLYTFLSK